MRWQAAIAVVTTVSSVCLVADVPAFAQSDSRSLPESSASPVIARHSPAPVLRVYESERPHAAASVAFPQKLTIPDVLRPTIERMLEQSPTFRRQVLRFAQAPGLMVRIALLQGKPSTGVRARTEMDIADRSLVANVFIKPMEDVVELIAHEFEHIIEQLDGVDLRARSAQSGTGVWSCDDGTFETKRAVRVGRLVAEETQYRR
jgi:hypothetical protein